MDLSSNLIKINLFHRFARISLSLRHQRCWDLSWDLRPNLRPWDLILELPDAWHQVLRPEILYRSWNLSLIYISGVWTWAISFFSAKESWETNALFWYLRSWDKPWEPWWLKLEHWEAWSLRPEPEFHSPCQEAWEASSGIELEIWGLEKPNIEKIAVCSS